MKAIESIISIAIVILISFQVFSPTTSAHTGENFMIIIKENESVPGNPTMMVNDSALWVNVDSRDNITHQIFVDANSDGIYNGSEDWMSVNLTHEGNCRNDNGTRIENCEASYTITFNESAMNMSYYDIVGTYAYIDIDSNGTKFYGNITVIPELHVTAGFQNSNTNNNIKDEEENSNFLLIVAAASAIGALGLGGMILFGNEEE
ncbi:MAG: hypothetical protein BEU01_01275 [Marine Group III euryarchaeote CG-Epi4]|uniref:Uncharacterized protein n=1 Tax=Marine Group III euryarchaeote CG-Epi4 TaxID=1888998 RepID=A0A1J5U3M3_9ARCH|nr:MAG: hypothetical protein BEU01_01275 [Marine Group III euryarchaeote CG-Epi4]|tara:strand:- start:750 stop:1364 length:615 start_codon:yes stop_codon:yes gene_type:complete